VLTGASVAAQPFDTAERATYLLGVIGWCLVLKWTVDVGAPKAWSWWQNLRWGLRFDLVEPEDTPTIPFTIEKDGRA
jgi:hypothetical protein